MKPSALLRLIILCLSITLFNGCETGPIPVQFDAPIKNRRVRLTHATGESFQIQRGKDTISYTVVYDRKSRWNYLIKSDSDTVFTGFVTRRRDLFFLHRPLDNGNFSVHALTVDDSSITGLESERFQAWIMEDLIQQKEYAKCVMDTNEFITLHVDKKLGSRLFSEVMDQLDPEVLIPESRPLFAENETLPQNANPPFAQVYPNPSSGFFNIELSTPLPEQLFLFNLQGQQISTLDVNHTNFTVDLSTYPSGMYLLQMATHEQAQTVLLVKE